MAMTESPPTMYSSLTNSDNSSTPTNDSVSTETMNNSSGSQMNESMRHLLIWGLPIIVLVGTVGNVLCIVVLRRKAMQTTPSSTYLMSLAVSDTVVLFISAAKTWLRMVSGFELLHVADIVCKMQKYIFISSSYICAWLVVILSLERFLVVTFPFKASSLALIRRPGIVTTLLSMSVFAINAYLLWSSVLMVPENGPKRCSIVHPSIWSEMYDVLNIIMYNLVPSALILILNSAIIAQILRSMRSVRQGRLLVEQTSSTKSVATMTVTEPVNPVVARATSTLSSRTQRRLTSTLTTICLMWFVLSTPSFLMDHIGNLKENTSMRVLAFLCLYANHAVNFYIYCLTGRKFRQELQRTFGCNLPKGNYHRTHKFVAQAKQAALNPEESQQLRGEKRSSRQGNNSDHLYN